MAELAIGVGDSVSRLLQVVAKDVGITGIKWHGRGKEDVRAVMLELFNSLTVKDVLWEGVKELMGMPELTSMPEPLQAKIAAIILTARAKIELQLK